MRPRSRAWLATLALLATTGAVMAPAATAAPKAKKASVSVTRLTGVPATSKAGATHSVTIAVRNKARRAAKKQVTLHLSRDTRLDPADTGLGKVKTGKLKAKAKKQVKATITLPASLTAGDYYVLACLKAQCRAAPTNIPAAGTTAPDKGSLTGTLTFRRTTPFEPDTTLDMSATVNVAMSYVGPVTRSDELQSTGSTYSFTRNTRREVVSGPCTTTTEDRGAGSGTLLESDNPYDDEIFGNMALLDLSEISLTTVLRYTHAVKTTVTGDETCDTGVTEGTPSAARQTTELKLSQVSRTATTITYRVSSWHDSSSTKSVWEAVEGTLTSNWAEQAPRTTVR